MRSRALAAVFLVALVTQAPASGARSPAILLAAGDIADCSSNGARLTAELIERLPGTVAALGDAAYPNGSASDFARCYDPTWGRFKNRTRPATGNHEYRTAGAGAYFAYFGRRSAPYGGFYSYELRSWHIVVVNSNCDEIGGCGPRSEQTRWLRANLARHRARCTLAYWHAPRFSSGPHGTNDPDTAEAMQPIWARLVKAHADIVLSAHDHLYQRFAPLNASGRVDRKHGVREFVVGTGGGPFYQAEKSTVGSRKLITDRFGVLRLVLKAGGYRWQFLEAPSGRVLDSGSGSCH
jgi:alkaline phosphatase